MSWCLVTLICVIQPILEAKATAVWLDKNYRPVRIPQEVRSKCVQFMRHEEVSWFNCDKNSAERILWLRTHWYMLVVSSCHLGCKFPFNKRKFPTWKRNSLSHKIHHTCSIHHVYVWSKQLSYTIIWKRGSLWNLCGLFNCCLPQAALSNEGEKTGYLWSVYQSIEPSLEHKCVF